MRLHRLDITAFGPFGTTQHVDFDALSAAGLFLLHGPTGAGKTSVLDAVCYALYGSVPGARQSGAGQGMNLRSDHAEPGTRTEVRLELTVAGRRLEVTRQPPWERPKLRGKGTTVDKAQTWLREYDAVAGAWKDLSRSHQEIGAEFEQLLGMSREQFCQVVLLPQGDFARFLRADAEARGRLLGRLFDTQRFADVEKRLAERRRAAEARVREGDAALLADAHRMQQAAGDAMELPELAPGDPGLAETVLGAAAVARTTARERLAVAHSRLAAAESAHADARRALDEERELARLQGRFAEARRRAERLDARAGDHREDQERMARSRKAEQVAPALHVRAEAEREHRGADAAEARARSLLPGALADADASALAAAARRAAEELGGLDAARRAERRLAEVTAERAGLDRQERADEDVLREADAWLEGWDTARADLQARIDTAQEAATRAEQLGVRREPMRRRLAAARTRDALTEDLETARRRAQDAAQRALDARAHWLDLKEQRLTGIAAELAAHLADGEPCAVCGATEHPAPARKVAGHVDRAAEEQAHAAAQEADRRHTEAERSVAAVRESLAAATAEAGETPTGELAAEADELEQEYARARQAASGLHAAHEELRSAEQERERRLAERQQAAVRAASRLTRREALEREQTQLEAELAKARGAADSVAARAAELERQAALYTEAAEAVRAAEDSAQRLKTADARLADAAYRAGFATPEAAAAALLTDDGHRELQHRLDAWQSEESAVRAVLAEADTAAAARGRPPTWPAPNGRLPRPSAGCGRPSPPATPPTAAAPNWTGCPPAPPRPCAGSDRCARSTTGSPGSPPSPRAPPPTTSAGCAWSRTCSPPVWNRSPPPRPSASSACPPAATPSSTPTTAVAAAAAVSACTWWTPGPAANGTPRPSPAARPSSPPWPSPSASPTSSPTRPAASAWTPSSSTRASAASTTRPWTRSSTSSTACANATAAWASSAMSPICAAASTPNWRS
ncbi:Exonuclease SbcC [Streptomyces misionensis JCM 4497]